MLPVTPMQRRLLEARYSNAKGRIIPMHHAFKIIKFGPATRMGMIFMPVLFLLGVWLSFGHIVTFWHEVFSFWMTRLVPDGAVGHTLVGIIGQSVNMPYPDLKAELPTVTGSWINLIVCAVIFIISLFMPGKMMPATYLIRAALFIQASASVYFLLSPHEFPYTISSYVIDMLSLGLYMLFMVPFVLALVFYIFDFPIWWKCFITLATLLFFSIGLPMQYMMHAYILHSTSYIFLPVLYFLFGVLLDVLMFINFYAIGMGRSRDQRSDLGRYA
jgi:hypothetical protein